MAAYAPFAVWVHLAIATWAFGQGLTLVHFSAQLSVFYAIGGARRDCIARFKGVLGGV